MPHQCTNCGHTFPDGSKEMLSGCPDCGGNKFQFKPAGSDDEPAQPQQPTDQQPAQSTESPSEPSTEPPSAQSTESPSELSSEPSTSGSTPESPHSAPETAGSPPETEGVGDDSGFVSKELEHTDESPAQSTARSEVVSSSELTAAGATAPTDDSTDADADSAPDSSVDQPTADTETDESSLDQLRKELNDQFESIRIVSPGQYELNLMELYDREEYIISLREDGRYVIEVPDGWGDS